MQDFEVGSPSSITSTASGGTVHLASSVELPERRLSSSVVLSSPHHHSPFPEIVAPSPQPPIAAPDHPPPPFLSSLLPLPLRKLLSRRPTWLSLPRKHPSQKRPSRKLPSPRVPSPSRRPPLRALPTQRRMTMIFPTATSSEHLPSLFFFRSVIPFALPMKC